MITLLNAPFHTRYFEQSPRNAIADPIAQLVERELYLKIVPARNLFSRRSYQLIGKEAYDKLINGLSSTFKTDLIFTTLFTTISVTRSLVFDPIVGEVHTLIKFSGELQREDQLEVDEMLSQLTSNQLEQMLLQSISAKDFIAIQASIFALQQRSLVTDKFVKTAIMVAALEDQLPILNFLIAYQEKFFCLNSEFYHMLLSLLINSNQLESFGLVLEKTVHSQCLTQKQLFSIAIGLVQNETKLCFLDKITQLEAFKDCFVNLDDWRKVVIKHQNSRLLKTLLPMIFESVKDINQYLDPILTEAIIHSNTTTISLILGYPGLIERVSVQLIVKLICIALHCKANEIAILILSHFENCATRDFFDQLFSCALNSSDPILKDIIDFCEPELSSQVLAAGLTTMLESKMIDEALRAIQILLERKALDRLMILRAAFVAIDVSNVQVFNDLLHLSMKTDQKLNVHFHDFLYCCAVNNKVAFFEYFLNTLFFSEWVAKDIKKQMYSYLILALDHGSHDVATCIIGYDEDYDLLSISGRAFAFRRFLSEDYLNIAAIQCTQKGFNRVLSEYGNQISKIIHRIEISEIRKVVQFLNSQDVPLSLMSFFGDIFVMSIFSNRHDITALFVDEPNFTDLLEAPHLYSAFRGASLFRSIECMEKIINLTKRMKFPISDEFFDGVLKAQVESGILERVEFVCLQAGYEPCRSDIEEMIRYARLLGYEHIASFLRNLSS
jgi:hypothetical protein